LLLSNETSQSSPFTSPILVLLINATAFQERTFVPPFPAKTKMVSRPLLLFVLRGKIPRVFKSISRPRDIALFEWRRPFHQALTLQTLQAMDEPESRPAEVSDQMCAFDRSPSLKRPMLVFLENRSVSSQIPIDFELLDPCAVHDAVSHSEPPPSRV
jgi:hypothetical protein